LPRKLKKACYQQWNRKKEENSTREVSRAILLPDLRHAFETLRDFASILDCSCLECMELLFFRSQL